MEAWAQGPHHLRLPVSAHPHPFQPRLAVGEKKRNFLACWDLPHTPLCKDNLKLVGAYDFHFSPRN